MDRRACKDADPEIFFPDKTELHTKANEAISMCFGCKVRAECVELGKLTGSKYGIWGGVLKTRGDK